MINKINSHLILLLQLLSTNSDIKPLLDRGLTYYQISKLYVEAVSNKLVERIDGKLCLTSQGKTAMNINAKSGLQRKDGGWISSEENFRIEPWPLDRVYLPRK